MLIFSRLFWVVSVSVLVLGWYCRPESQTTNRVTLSASGQPMDVASGVFSPMAWPPLQVDAEPAPKPRASKVAVVESAASAVKQGRPYRTPPQADAFMRRQNRSVALTPKAKAEIVAAIQRQIDQATEEEYGGYGLEVALDLPRLGMLGEDLGAEHLAKYLKLAEQEAGEVVSFVEKSLVQGCPLQAAYRMKDIDQMKSIIPSEHLARFQYPDLELQIRQAIDSFGLEGEALQIAYRDLVHHLKCSAIG